MLSELMKRKFGFELTVGKRWSVVHYFRFMVMIFRHEKYWHKGKKKFLYPMQILEPGLIIFYQIHMDSIEMGHDI